MSIFTFTFQQTKNLRYLYAVRIVRDLANQLVVFFLPLYFFNLRFPFMQRFELTALQEGIFNVALVYALTYLACFFLAIPTSKILTKHGIRYGFLLGHLLYALYVLCLLWSQNNPYLVLTSAIINGLQINFFWNSYHYSLSRYSSENKIGSNLGIINFLLNLLAMVAPALGGIIIMALGYQTLFLLGLFIVLFGAMFSLMLDNVRVRDEISFKEFFSWMSEPTFRRLAASFTGRYFNDASINLWTLYMFILLGSYDGVGYFYSLSLFMALVISYFAGSFIDRNKGQQQFFMSGGLLSIFWLLRSFAVNIWTITFINAFDKLTSSFHWLFFDRSWIMRGKGREALSYFVYREMIYSLAALVFWGFVALIFYFFIAAWKSLFVAAAIGVLLTLLIKEHKADHEEV